MAQGPAHGGLRVMFDPQIFCHQRFGGVSRYFCSMALQLRQLPGIEPLIVAPFHFNEYLEQLPPALVRGRRLRWLEGHTALAYGLSVLPAMRAARRGRPDILHSTYYFPVRAPAGTRGILTIYDMIHEKFPEYFGPQPTISRLKAASVARADHIICISQSTRRDVLEAYDIAPERVSVTHLGFDPLQSLLSGEPGVEFRTRVLGSDTPYLLYVGSRPGHKNFAGLLEAFGASAWLRENFLLLCLRYWPPLMRTRRCSCVRPSTRASAFRCWRRCRWTAPWPAAIPARCRKSPARRPGCSIRPTGSRSARRWRRC